MAREINRLNARVVATLKEPGRYADGRGLYLRVTPTQKSWTFMFKWRGKPTEVGLGSAATVSLADARKKAEAARKKLDEGIHPAADQKEAVVPLFGDFADEFIETMAPSWRNPKHDAQWRMTLGRARDADGKLTKVGYCLSLASKPLDQIGVDDILEVLRPIWHTKPETASRIRGRLENVLDAAKARGYRTGENPAAWKGNLALILPKRSKAKTVTNHPAMHYAEIPAFLARLRKSGSSGALALEFLILTAARSGEVRGATWREIDLANKLWIIPGERMKAGREHRVPLTDRALAVLENAALLRQTPDGGDPADAHVFPGMRRGSALSDMTLTASLRRLGHGDVTAHGFRSSFRDWAGDCTHHPRELIEQALAHTVGGVEGAYRRMDALEKRRVLMGEWSAFVSAPPKDGKVVPIRKADADAA